MRARDLVLLLLILISCDPEVTEFPVKPIFETQGSGEVASTFHFLGIEWNKKQKDVIQSHLVDYGFVWSEHENNTLDNGTVISLGDTLEFTGAELGNLKSHTRYYAIAYMTMDDGKTFYGNEINFYTRKGGWKKLSDFPGEPFTHGTGFSLGNKGYVVTREEVWRYDPSADQWERMNNFPAFVDGPASFVIDNIAYVYCNGIYRYDEEADSWQQVALSDPDKTSGCLGAQAAVVDGKAYISTTSSLYSVLYDPQTDRVEYTEWFNYQLTNRYSCMLAFDNRAFAFGGYWGGSVNASRWTIDPREQKVTRAQDVILGNGNLGRGDMVGFVIDDEPYLGFGFDGYESNLDFYHYNYRINQWEQLTIPATSIGGNIDFFPRQGGVAFSIGNKGYVGMGVDQDRYAETPTLLSDFWEFTPD